MTSILAGENQIDIPSEVRGFKSFRRWLHSPSFPETGKICFINGRVWVDLSMEDYVTHNRVRTEITTVLNSLVEQMEFGEYVSEGMRYSHPETNLSTEPDGMILSNESIESGQVRFVGGKDGGQTELVGTPDIAIEVVSKTSVVKETEWAVMSYFDAGIPEYWLIDAREEDDVSLLIYKRARNEYVAARKAAGWVKSGVLGKSFRLQYTETASGRPKYKLEVR